MRLTLALKTFLKILYLLKKQNKLRHRQKLKILMKLKEGLKDKPLYGKYPIRASDPDVSSSLTHQWLTFIGLQSETESFIIAAQDQSLPTRNFQADILENGAHPNGGVSDKHSKTISHLVSGGPILAPTEYLNWHDRLGQYIHWRLCKTFVCHVKGIGVNINQQKSLQKCHRFMGLTSILVNWPDTVVKNHTDKTCFLIDMYVPSDNIMYHSKSLKN